MEADTTKPTKIGWGGVGNLLREGRLSIGTRLTACFVAIVLSMIAANVVIVWQLRQMATPTQRLSAADQRSLAILRVHLDVDQFRDRATALASSHDTRQFASEIASLRSTFLRDIEHAEQELAVSPADERDPTISSALETLRVAVPSQLDTSLALATAGDWNAIGLQLVQQSGDPIHLSSLLVERLNQQLLQDRAKAIESTQQARQRLFIIVPIAALLTLLTAAALGWYTTRTITAPLSELTAAAEALARRNFHHQVNVSGHDELAVLGKAFNYAAWQLQQLYEDLRHSEQELRDVINTVPAHVWSASPDGTLDFINERLQRFLGLPPDHILGWTWQSIVHPDERGRFIAEWDVAVKRGQAIESEVRVRQVDGQYCWFFLRNVPLRDETGKLIKWFGSGIEIQDRKRAEQERERLRQLESELAHLNRLGMIGELTASLSHELKQPIAAAITNCKTSLRWLRRDQPDLGEAREAIARSVRDAARAAEIIDHLRSFYEKGIPPERELVDVNQSIREMLVLMRTEASRYSVSMCTKLAAEVPKVTADRVQVQQVLMNLMLNGIEAMKDSGGELTLKSQLGPEGQVMISVSDTGIGLPAEKVAKIFTAFFTTKPRGSGMGLAISRSIVESHGGRLWATPNTGRGATFHFTLPNAAEELKAPATGT